MNHFMGLLRDKQLPQRTVLYIFGIFLISLGAAFNIVSDIGVSAMQAPSLILSLATGLSIGTWLFLMLATFILLQILILRREFRLVSLAQIVVSFVFGYFMDFSTFLVRGLQPSSYIEQLLLFGIGTILSINGVMLYVRANLINMPPEALTTAITKKIPNGKFHRVRIVQDCSLVVIAAVLSFLLLHGLYGIREGTVLSAVLIGKGIPYASRLWQPVLRRIGLGVEGVG